MAKPIKILVVDDLAEKILVYVSLLEEPGREIITARSGADALRAILDHDFAVIILDVNMPGMDGFETASYIRKRKRSVHTPIIFATAHTDEMHSLRGYAQGAVDFISTPIIPEILRTKVNVFVDLFRLNQQAIESAAAQVARAEQERAHLSSVLERSSDLVARLDPQGRVMHINAAGRDMLGYGEEWNPTSFAELLTDDQARLFEEVWLPHCHREGLWFGESALRCRNGHGIPVSQMILARQSSDGVVDHLSVVARDISERVDAEQALAISERRYRQLVHGLPAAVYTCDERGRITLFNQAAAALWGREPVIGDDCWCGSSKMFNIDGTPLALDQSPMALALRKGQSIRGQELIIERPDGSRSYVLPHPEPLFDASGRVVGAINMLIDLTDRRRAEEVRAQLAALVDSTDDAVISKTPEGVITFCNRAAERLFGYKPAELIGRHVTTIIPTERYEEEKHLFDRLRAGNRIENFETVRLTRDGRSIDVSLTVSPVRDPLGRVAGISSIARDITERQRSARALRESEVRLRTMFGQAAVGIVLLDQSGRLLEVNQRMCQIVRRTSEELCCLTCRELTHPDDWPINTLLFEDVLAGRRRDFAIEKRYARGDGSWVWINSTVSLLDDASGDRRMVAVIEDISARKHAEQELVRHRAHLEDLVRERTAELELTHTRLRLADRLASIGSLAAGLGHDLGNLLLPLRMRLEVLESMSLPDAARGDLKAIGTVCKYLESLNHGLRLFALNPDDTRSTEAVTDIPVWWGDVAPFLRNALPKSVALVHHIATDLPRVAIAPHLLAQVVYNLVQNAGDALHQISGARVEIAFLFDAASRVAHVVVADNGSGMDDEVRERCMQPFYSTKSRGSSSGLGLALVAGAMRNVGGSVQIDSEVGKGTSVRLAIPIVHDSADEDAPQSAEAAFVSITAPRLRADIAAILRSSGLELLDDVASLEQARFLIIDAALVDELNVAAWLRKDPGRQAILVGSVPPATSMERAIFVEGSPSAARLRGIIISIMCSHPTGEGDGDATSQQSVGAT